MRNDKKPGALTRAGRRIAAVTVIAAATLSLVAGSAQARPNDGWYRCWIDGYGWMWCMDV